MMKKIKAGSLVELCRIVGKLQLQTENSDKVS